MARRSKTQLALRAEKARLEHLEQVTRRRPPSSRLNFARNPGMERIVPSIAPENRQFGKVFYTIPVPFAFPAAGSAPIVSMFSNIDPDADFVLMALNIRCARIASPVPEHAALFPGQFFFDIKDTTRNYVLGQRYIANVPTNSAAAQQSVLTASLDASVFPIYARYAPIGEHYRFVRNGSINVRMGKNSGLAVACDVTVILIGYKDYSK